MSLTSASVRNFFREHGGWYVYSTIATFAIILILFIIIGAIQVGVSTLLMIVPIR